MTPQPTPSDEFAQPQIVQTSISDKTLKELGEMVVSTVLEVQRLQQQTQVEEAKQNTEQLRLDNQLQLEQLRIEERMSTTQFKWNTIFKGLVVVTSFGSLIAIYQLDNPTLLTALLSVITFTLGSIFNNPVRDMLNVTGNKKGQNDAANNP